MDFAKLKTLAIPEGKVKKIMVQEKVLWKRPFVNQIPISTDTDGSIFNGTGYMKDARFTVDGDVAERGILKQGAGFYATGFIPIISGSSRYASGETVLYFKNMQVPLDSYTHLFLYGLDKICIGMRWATSFSPATDGLNPVYTLDENGYINSLDISALTGYYKQGEPLYIRLDMQGLIDENSIITVNEPIV